MRDEEKKKLGYNDCLTIGGRTFHLQTEVIGKTALQIKTTIIENGAILDAILAPLPTFVDVVQGQTLVQKQHQRILQEVQDGAYC